MAARELGSLSPADALSLVLLYQRAGDEKFERAARRWIRRTQIDHVTALTLGLSPARATAVGALSTFAVSDRKGAHHEETHRHRTRRFSDPGDRRGHRISERCHR